MGNTTLEVLLPLIYIIPSLILYVMELIIMICYRSNTKFTGSFFTIFVCSAINNIFCEIFYFLTYRATKVPIFASFFSSFSDSGFFITLPTFITYIAGAAQAMLDFCICFNRFTVFYLGAKHVEFWRRWCKIILIVVYIIAAGITWEAWVFKVKITPVDPLQIDSGFNWGITDPNVIPWIKVPLLIAGNVIITASWSFMMNLYVCWFLLKRKTTKKNTGFSISSSDVRLFSFNLLIFLTQATQFFLQMIFLFSPKERAIYSFTVKIQFVVMDINCLASAWFILLTSSPLRKAIFRLIFCRVFDNKIHFLKKLSSNVSGPKKRVQTAPPTITIFRTVNLH
ncbi:hypothetical protein FO519_001789 [Halicephalobus sp. NKZ332]|nr:hypothetical protein FO519_001789 [Halicephalobus sp. NKZ332]